jgi:hypothetical protein
VLPQEAQELATTVVLLAAVVTAVHVLWRRFVAPLIAQPLGNLLVAAIAEALEDRWEDILDRRLCAAIRPLENELSTNGGSSLKDAVLRIERTLDEHERTFREHVERHR